MIDGSPLIAMKSSAKNGTKFTRLYFIENSARSIEELRALTSMDRRCEVIPGDVNDELPKLMRRIHRRAPTFIFLDTAGIEPRWNTIQAIAPWQIELLINFPLGMSLNRNPDSVKTEAYFGTREFYPFLRYRGLGKARALLDLYKNRLASLGLTHTTADDRLIQTRNGRRLYYLVFVGKHPAGERIMTSVFKQPDAQGQRRLQI
jgi:three-Cys-motif partner protein